LIRYGVEGIVYSSPNPEDQPLLQFNSAQNSLLSNDGKIEIRLFQKIKVQITVTDAGENQAQRSKLVLKLTYPRIQGMVPDQDSKVPDQNKKPEPRKKQRVKK
jgi:hypothetical protein